MDWQARRATLSSAVDYVIVHELAHLLEANHGDRLWSIVRAQIPRAEVARRWLRDRGQVLEQDV
jgi:predicted metal-dependent hydrolase